MGNVLIITFLHSGHLGQTIPSFCVFLSQQVLLPSPSANNLTTASNPKSFGRGLVGLELVALMGDEGKRGSRGKSYEEGMRRAQLELQRYAVEGGGWQGSIGLGSRKKKRGATQDGHRHS